MFLCNGTFLTIWQHIYGIQMYLCVFFSFIVATFQCLATSAHIKLHFYVLGRLSRLFLPEADNRLGAEDPGVCITAQRNLHVSSASGKTRRNACSRRGDKTVPKLCRTLPG